MRLLPTLCVILPAVSAPAMAQVTVDLHALQALPERPAAEQPVHRPAVIRPTAAPSRTERPAGQPLAKTQVPTAHESEGDASKAETGAARPEPSVAKGGSGPEIHESPIAKGESPVVPPAPAPALPQTAPQTAAIEPVAPPPPAVAPPAPPVAANAGTTTTPTAAGLRLTFEPGKSDLTPENVASIKQLTSRAGSAEGTSFTVSAYAPGTQDDPSTARRLSLSRAMAVRSALVADGVASPRIFVRALGAQYGSGPPDRVDLDVEGLAPEAASK